jgi:hypothetical protein
MDTRGIHLQRLGDESRLHLHLAPRLGMVGIYFILRVVLFYVTMLSVTQTSI